MSTDLREVPGTTVTQTRFWGGDDRGVCIQLTKSTEGRGPRPVDFVQLTRDEAKALSVELMLFGEGLEVEMPDEVDDEFETVYQVKLISD